jgi:DNA modification methylase
VGPGDLWILGDHRLVCGDCTDKKIIKGLLDGERADALITDPPYNISDFDESNVDYGEWDKAFDSLGWWESIRFALTDNHSAYVFGSHRTLAPLWLAWEQDADYYGHLVWIKTGVKPNWRNWNWATELIAYRQMKGRIYHRVGNGRNIYKSAPPHNRDHPNQKDVGVMEWLIEASTNPDSLVLDTFCGSGTTIIACQNLGRQCRATEQDPKYVAATLERWHLATGIKPEKIGWLEGET